MEKKKSKVGKIVKGALTFIGGAVTVSCAAYVIKEVKKEYDETIDENNRLRDFINTHDFYEKQKSIYRSTNNDESNDVEEKFDPNNPVYKQSPATMRKLGLNPDGTKQSKTEMVKIEEQYNSEGYIVEIWEDIPTGLRLIKTTDRKVSEEEKIKEA